jgi:hypothetical protein
MSSPALWLILTVLFSICTLVGHALLPAQYAIAGAHASLTAQLMILAGIMSVVFLVFFLLHLVIIFFKEGP